MTKYEVLVSETARKELNDLKKGDRERVRAKLKELGEDPFNSQNRLGVKKLSGTKRLYYRLRIGIFRAIYFIEGNNIKVVRVATRSDVYSWLD